MSRFTPHSVYHVVLRLSCTNNGLSVGTGAGAIRAGAAGEARRGEATQRRRRQQLVSLYETIAAFLLAPFCETTRPLTEIICFSILKAIGLAYDEYCIHKYLVLWACTANNKKRK